MLTRRSGLVYGALVAVWAFLIGWQIQQHLGVEDAGRNRLINRANVAADTLGVVVRSLSRYGVVDRTRLEYALKELVKKPEQELLDPAEELRPVSLVLLNVTNGLVASGGDPVPDSIRDQLANGEFPRNQYWDEQAKTVTVLVPEDLGTNIMRVVASPAEVRPRFLGTNFTPGTNYGFPTDGRGTPPGMTNPADFLPPPPPPDGPAALDTNASIASNSTADRPAMPLRGGRGDRGDFPMFFRRPPYMTAAYYNDLIQRQGLHGLILVMPAEKIMAEIEHDLWLRVFICLLGTVSVAGFGLAWSNLDKTSVLQIRLVRQSELNSHLKEMNLAAAGLAHETRNPLNIIRGLAQMISRRDDASPEVRARSREIVDETDRITSQLNEFINYSRPREVRLVRVDVNALAAEVVRALNYDLEEKKVQIRVLAEPLAIQADEQLLRQALFNLVINAIQAVRQGGEIWIRAGRSGADAYIEVADNGPGVAPEHVSELFKPYFTTHSQGTGLGLAVVQQIVLAHGWEIQCLANQPAGAIFRLSHIRPAAKT